MSIIITMHCWNGASKSFSDHLASYAGILIDLFILCYEECMHAQLLVITNRPTTRVV